MKLLSEWGFTREGWRTGERGEYWVLAQAILFLGFLMLPIYRPEILGINSAEGLYLVWGIAAALGLGAFLLFVKGFLDLGRQLTPLPYPKEQGQLVQFGVYSLVRHPIYSGVILAALSWAIFQFSFSHFIATAIIFTFFDAKARREEAWLSEKYPDYSDYQQRVKKLIPGLY